MENQYTYYKPEPDDMNGMNEETPKPKKNRKVPNTTIVVCQMPHVSYFRKWRMVVPLQP